MGMTIEEHIAQLKKLKPFHNGSYGASINFAIETIRKYQKLQSDYENRFKDDMVAMLTEIQLEIEEKASEEGDWIFAEGERFCGKLIQQKINSLKEVKDGESNN